MKLIALYKQPQDTAAFDDAYFNTHIPLMQKVPGIQDIKFTRFTRNLMGENFYLMTEMTFTDSDSLKSAMRSPEMAAAGENLNTFAAGLTTLLFGQEQVSPATVQ